MPGSRPVEVFRKQLGTVHIHTARLDVADPLIMDFTGDGGLAREVPCGSFPVDAAIAQFDHDDQRIACARVHFGQERVAVRWEPALYLGQEPLREEERPGSGVDSGTWGFFDAGTTGAVDEETAQGWLDALQKNSVSTWTFLDAELEHGNVVMLSSGWGDGFYTSYWGFSAAGELAELVSDFQVLMGPAEVERVTLTLPLRRGWIRDPVLRSFGVEARVPMLNSSSIELSGPGAGRVELPGGDAVALAHVAGNRRRYSWDRRAAGEVEIVVMRGDAPYEPLEGEG